MLGFLLFQQQGSGEMPSRLSVISEAQRGSKKRIWGIKQDKSFYKHFKGGLLPIVHSKPFAWLLQLQKHLR